MNEEPKPEDMTPDEYREALRKEIAGASEELAELDADTVTHSCPVCSRHFTNREMAAFNMCPVCGRTEPMMRVAEP